MLSDTELDDLLADLESDRVERKRSLTEKEKIRERIHADFDKRGRPRRERSTLNRHRNAVTKCIKEAIEEIRAVHPDLAAHLELAIKYGYDCSYRPQEDPGWLFDW